MRNQYKLSDSDKLSVYHQHYWLEWILNGENQTDYPNPLIMLYMQLMKRWTFLIRVTNTDDKRDLKEHPKFLDWVLVPKQRPLKNGKTKYETI